MLKKNKKIISMILTVAIILSVLLCTPFSASAATLVWPVNGHTSLSRDFWQHGGEAIDISDSSINGATVRAAMGGTVTSIWLCPNNHYGTANPYPNCCSGNGHGLVICGDDGRYYNYAHMQAGSIPTNEVHYGARVEAGQVIGKVGSTGNSSGPHLHFLISTSSRWWESGFVNPQNETYTYYSNSTSVDLGDDFYCMIINQPSWKSIGRADNKNVEIISESRETYDRILWHFKKYSNSDNSYLIESLSENPAYSGDRLNVYNAEDANYANVGCVSTTNLPSQIWYIYQNGDGSYRLKPAHSDRVLDVNAGNSADGTNVQIYENNGSNAQKFEFYKLDTNRDKLNYSISAQSTQIEANGSTTITVGGNLPYVYNYKFHIVDSYGNEKIIDNKCNPNYTFKPTEEGKYIIYAEVKNPLYSEKGSVNNKSVTINVGCAHEFIEQFIEAGKKETQGYVLYTCKKCGKTYKGNYMDYKDGWYYPESLPDIIDSQKYDIEYDNYYEKVQKDSPGSDWTKGETVQNEWVNSGGQYDSYSPLQTSDSRVLVKECYYHWCIPNAGMGTEGNYEQTDKFNHYDEIVLPNTFVHEKWTGDDNGHTVYVLTWDDGNEIYCKSGEQCDGSWGFHDYRCRAWYKKYVYQDRVKSELYKYTKDSGWTNKRDDTATNVSVRFKAKTQNILGDADSDGEVNIKDVTCIQMYLANFYSKDKINLYMCDVDGDGEVNIRDATNIQMRLAGFI